MELFSQPISKYVARDPKARAYNLKTAEDKRLARLFIDDDSYVLIWYGHLEFASLADLIGFRLLNDVLGSYWDIFPLRLSLFPVPILTAQVSLIVEENDMPLISDSPVASQENGPKLIRFQVTKTTQLTSHSDLQHPNRISFARMDYTIRSGIWHAHLAFTAENPKLKPAGKAEIGIRTPRSYRYSSRLFSFIDDTVQSGNKQLLNEFESPFSSAIRQQLNILVHESSLDSEK